MQDEFNYRVTLSPSQKEFACLPNTSVLESGIAAGVALPYSCANGSCGDCRAKILSGTVIRSSFHDYALTERDKSEGICLLCSNTALSDLVIEVSIASSVEDIPLQQRRMKICHVEELAGLSIVRFKITRGKALRFLPGQYTRVMLPMGESRVLPIANCPCETSFIEFHIPNTLSRDFPISKLQRRDRVEIEGPLGAFTINSNKGQSPSNGFCFIAVGEHFAAVKPILEHIISLDIEEQLTFVWVATEKVSHYKHNLCRSWADAFDWFSYIPLAAMPELQSTLHTGNFESQSIFISASADETKIIADQCKSIGLSEIIFDRTLQ